MGDDVPDDIAVRAENGRLLCQVLDERECVAQQRSFGERVVLLDGQPAVGGHGLHGLDTASVGARQDSFHVLLAQQVDQTLGLATSFLCDGTDVVGLRPQLPVSGFRMPDEEDGHRTQSLVFGR